MDKWKKRVKLRYFKFEWREFIVIEEEKNGSRKGNLVFMLEMVFVKD